MSIIDAHKRIGDMLEKVIEVFAQMGERLNNLEERVRRLEDAQNKQNPTRYN